MLSGLRSSSLPRHVLLWIYSQPIRGCPARLRSEAAAMAAEPGALQEEALKRKERLKALRERIGASAARQVGLSICG